MVDALVGAAAAPLPTAAAGIDATVKVLGASTTNSTDAENKIHRCDQRQAEIHFESDDGRIRAKLRQHGAGTSKFVGDTSSVLWPVARHFCRWLCKKYAHHAGEAGKTDTRTRCIELGSGTGLVGIVCGHLGIDTTLTDQTLDLCEENILLQPEEVRANLRAKELVWGLTPIPEAEKYDLVVASDVICHQDKSVMQVLVETIRSLIKTEEPSAVAYVAYEFRDDWWTCSSFCDLCKKYGFEMRSWSLEEDDEDSDFILYELRLAADGVGRDCFAGADVTVDAGESGGGGGQGGSGADERDENSA